MHRRLLFSAALLGLSLISSPGFSATEFSTVVIQVAKVGEDNGLPVVTSADRSLTYSIHDTESAGLIRKIQPGDRIEVVLDGVNSRDIQKIQSVSRPVASRGTRFCALFIGFLIIVGFFSVVSGFKPKVFLVGADNRYSNSKVQVVLWFGAMMTVYLATLWLRWKYLGWDYFGGIAITENLLALSGISALTYGAAKAVTAQKAESAEQAAAAAKANGKELPPTKPMVDTTAGDANTSPQDAQATQPNKPTKQALANLFQNDYGDFDLGDTQMFFFILLAVAMFLLNSFHFLGWLEYAKNITLPDVDTTLLSGIGLSQGAYLAKKAASEPGKG